MTGHHPHHDFRRDIWVVVLVIAAIVLFVARR